MTKEVGTSIST